jgi:dipeptidyl aminopeptidase/acylaminoacyl peptidase
VPTDMHATTAELSRSGAADRPAAAILASPLEHVTGDFPPTMLIHGADDEVVPVRASLEMHEALLAAGVPTELHVYPDQGHAFDAHPDFGRRCAAEMGFFLDRYVRGREVLPD